MKKIFSLLFLMLSIISLVYLYQNTDILDFVKYNKMSNEQKEKYTKGWYYDKLDNAEKEIYVYYANGVENIEEKIRVKIKTVASSESLKEMARKAIEAYKHDYLETFYMGSQYSLSIINLGQSKLLEISPEYLETDINSIKTKQNEMNKEIGKVSELLTDKMSDYQKELIVHDYLVKNIEYPKYEDISLIPQEMHTSYNALVKKQAVCDGISKAFAIIMKSQNIDCILVIGNLEDSPHAWNIIKLDEDYYHVDVTSDEIEFEGNNKVGTIHAYLNITDSEISKKHTISKNYNYPKCNSTEYNYYYLQNQTISKSENIDYKLRTINNINANENVLEIRVLKNENAAEQLVQGLYNINFNNYRTNQNTSVAYTKIRDIYIFEKK